MHASKILVIKLRYIGDVLLSTPVLKNLRLYKPAAQIDMLVNRGTGEILGNNTDCSEILFAERGGWIDQLRFMKEIRRRGYDLVVDLTDSDRSAILTFFSGAPTRVGYNQERRWRGRCYTHLVPADRDAYHTVDYHLEALRVLGIPIKNPKPALPLRSEDVAEAGRIRAEHGVDDGRPVVLFHPGARWWFKSWPPECFAELAGRVVKELGAHAVLAGTAADLPVIRHIQDLMSARAAVLAGQTTVNQMAAFLKQCRLYVGNDNGIMHIAAAVGIPVVAFFGLTHPKLWGPYGAGHRTFYKGVDCGPCFPNGCVRGDQSCMRLITVEEAFAAVKGLLGQRGGAAIPVKEAG